MLLENAYQILKPWAASCLLLTCFFPETDGKQAELWVGMIQQAGFDVIQMEDASAEAQAFFPSNDLGTRLFCRALETNCGRPVLLDIF